MTTSTKIQKITPLLRQIAGKNNVLTEFEDRFCYSADISSVGEKNYIPDVVILPETTQQVSEIIKLSNQYQIPIIARGAGTNHSSACVAVNGGIILHFSKMNKILEIDKENLVCTVQAGVTIEKIQQESEKLGLFYPPDPSNLKVSTIGGSIALSSGGPRAFKYGTTKDYILGLEAVLADGSIINTGSKLIKDVTGYNLTQLLVGSEGNLGVITQAHLRLIPQPEDKKVLLVFFNSIDDAANSVSEIVANKITPATLDLLDKATMQTIEKFYPTEMFDDSEAALLIEVDGFKETVNIQIQQIQALCRNAKNIKIAKTQEESDKIWFARRSAFAAVAKLGINVITEDATVPRNKIPDMVKEINRISNKYSLTVCIMGHAGDGNLHANFSLDLRDNESRKNLHLAIDELVETALAFGGSISGEHGIGLAKKKHLNKALDKNVLKYMQEIKKIFDPNNILNPQ